MVKCPNCNVPLKVEVREDIQISKDSSICVDVKEVWTCHICTFEK